MRIETPSETYAGLKGGVSLGSAVNILEKPDAQPVDKSIEQRLYDQPAEQIRMAMDSLKDMYRARSIRETEQTNGGTDEWTQLATRTPDGSTIEEIFTERDVRSVNNKSPLETSYFIEILGPDGQRESVVTALPDGSVTVEDRAGRDRDTVLTDFYYRMLTATHQYSQRTDAGKRESDEQALMMLNKRIYGIEHPTRTATE